MAKVFAMHTIMLYPTIKEQDFEKFVTEEAYPFFKSVEAETGWKFHLLKGHAGDRAGKYAVLWEIASLETLLRWYTPPGVPTEEVKQFQESHPELAELSEKWLTFTPHLMGQSTVWTDYVVVE